MPADGKFKSWSQLTENERARLLADYQSVLACEGPTCSFSLKLERMQLWLAERGVTITEDEIRGRR